MSNESSKSAQVAAALRSPKIPQVSKKRFIIAQQSTGAAQGFFNTVKVALAHVLAGCAAEPLGHHAWLQDVERNSSCVRKYANAMNIALKILTQRLAHW